MTKVSQLSLRPVLLIVALTLGLFTASIIISPGWLAHFGPHLGNGSVGYSGSARYDVLAFACVIALTCLHLVSLMLPERPVAGAHVQAAPPEISNQEDHAAAIEKEISENLSRIIGMLNTHSEASRLYAQCLEQAGRNLIELTSPEQLRVAIGYLISENNKMRKETGFLQDNLRDAQSQVDNLRSNLQRAEEDGLRDALTTLWNRRAFDTMLEQHVSSAQLKHQPLCLIMVDIDHFKRINDSFGHPIGDEVIRLVATTIAKNVKGRDMVARYGGEEFALILPQTALENAITLATQIKSQLESQRWILSRRNEVIGTVTASFGVAALQPGDHSESLVRRADSRLYEAKNAGRNRVAS
jgi:diguanylate cyclase